MQEDLPTGRPIFACHPSFLFLFGVFEGANQLPGAVPSLHANTGLEDELEAGRTSFLDASSASLLNESCDGDVEDETLSELVDLPGTTRGTKLSVLQITLFPYLVNRGF